MIYWVREVLDHLGECYDQWSDCNVEAGGALTAAIERDLDELRRVVQIFRMRRPAVAFERQSRPR